MRPLKIIGVTAVCGLAVLTVTTVFALKPVDRPFSSIVAGAHNVPVTDRSGAPLAVTYQAAWNRDDYRALYDIPPLLIDAFIYAEDRKFYEHHGVDWHARAAAFWQNIKSRQIVRGASTITEQAVRLINPRARNFPAKWLEGWEAMLLERGTDKHSILEFYINQVPYTAGRRGAAQAARYYFDRDLNTLSPREMLALAVLARAPSAYDLYRHPGKINASVTRLADALFSSGKINASIRADIDAQTLSVRKASLPVDARHFARHIKLSGHAGKARTTLDAALQGYVQGLLDARVKRLAAKNVVNGGAVVIDHENGDILAWVVAGADDSATPGGEIDTITSPRQPGSTLKPFLYAAALEKGWSAATILNDTPVAEAVGAGLHRFRNYSNTHYGPITLREALGNSLNIPALITIGHVGAGDYLSTLQKLGFKSLSLSSDIYDEGLALGNGEVTLLEMVAAYAALANHGEYRPLHIFQQDHNFVKPVQVYSEESTSIIGNILSDNKARRLEFGAGSVLNFPLQTAAKTGTSTDYRDAWTMAYNDRYVVGIWMGNLDRTSMNNVTGASGPALALRSIFSILNENRQTQPLYLSPRLVAHDVCIRPANADGSCPKRNEWFMPDTVSDTPAPRKDQPPRIELVRPTDGLQIAYDPRIPATHQHFRFELKNVPESHMIKWTVDEKIIGEGASPTLLWPVQKGKHILSVQLLNADNVIHTLPNVTFFVK